MLGRPLQYLTEANLEEIGITAVGPRNRIMRAVAFMVRLSSQRLGVQFKHLGDLRGDWAVFDW